MKKTLMLGVCAAMLVAMAAPAFAQYPPPLRPTCNIRNLTTGSHRTVSPGDEVEFGGRRWKANNQVLAGFHQGSSDTTITDVIGTDSTGTWHRVFTIPNTVENGDAAFGAQGRDRRGKFFRCIIPVQVVGAASVRASASEPAGITTGMVSLAVLGLAGVLLFWRNRRRVNSLAS